MGLWSARAGVVRPRCPQVMAARTVRGRPSACWDQASVGVLAASAKWWRAKADAALDGALKERETDTATGELAAAMQRIGELSMENELLRSRIERPGPLVRRRSR
jgi:transposase